MSQLISVSRRIVSLKYVLSLNVTPSGIHPRKKIIVSTGAFIVSSNVKKSVIMPVASKTVSWKMPLVAFFRSYSCHTNASGFVAVSN